MVHAHIEEAPPSSNMVGHKGFVDVPNILVLLVNMQAMDKNSAKFNKLWDLNMCFKKHKSNGKIICNHCQVDQPSRKAIIEQGNLPVINWLDWRSMALFLLYFGLDDGILSNGRLRTRIWYSN